MASDKPETDVKIEDALDPTDAAPRLTPDQERRLYRKVDLRLLPILWVMYLGSQLDRGNIGNAKLQGLLTELHLTGSRYNIALARSIQFVDGAFLISVTIQMMFFIPYCLLEFPSNLVIKRLRPSRWLPGITVVWGIVTTLMGLVKTYPQLVAVRTCLGVAEAGFFPGVAYYLSIWYPRHHLQYRIGLFYSAATVAGSTSGLLAFAIGFMSGTDGLLGWSWIFIIEGIVTVAVGVLAFVVMVDFPDTAGFLSEDERAYVIWRKRYDNSSAGEEERFALRHLRAVFTDWQLYLHVLVYISVITPVFGITLFLPSIISGFGFDTTVTQLLTIPPYAFATLVLISFGVYSDKLKLRSPFILAGLMMCLVGFAINIAPVPAGVKYAGTFLIVGGAYGAVPGVVAWLGNNLAGHYKRGAGMALHVGLGSFGGVFGSNIYRTQDAPRYLLGHAMELMFVGIGLVVVPIIVLCYARLNAHRARAPTTHFTKDELSAMGDRAPDFRYTL